MINQLVSMRINVETTVQVAGSPIEFAGDRTGACGAAQGFLDEASPERL